MVGKSVYYQSVMEPEVQHEIVTLEREWYLLSSQDKIQKRGTCVNGRSGSAGRTYYNDYLRVNIPGRSSQSPITIYIKLNYLMR